MTNNQYPQQKISLSDKLRIEDGEKIPKWIVDNAEFFSNSAGFGFNNRIEIDTLYKIADGNLSEEDYKYVENPFNTKNLSYTKYPAKIRNYDIIKPIIDRLLGEREETPINQIIVGSNADSVNEIKEGVNEEINNRIRSMFTARLTGKKAKDDLNIAEIESSVLLNYNAKKTKDARVVLERVKRSQNLSEKLQKLFYDYLVCGRPATFKTVNHDDVIYETIHPSNIIGVGWDESSPYLEDCAGCVAYRYWSPNTIIDRFRESLTDDQITYLSQINPSSEAKFSTNNGLANGVDRTRGWNTSVNGVDYNVPYDGTLIVEHIVWKTLTKRGKLTYKTDFGEEKMEVDETYVLETEKGDISIDWVWENEIWEIYRVIDNYENSNRDYTVDSIKHTEYLYYGPCLVQRNEVNNTSVCKLPYNQVKRGYSYTDTIQSVIKDGLPYQILYNILHYRFELSLAKNKDKLMLFPLGLIPSVRGWDVDKWMYNIHAFGVAFFNEQDSKAAQAIQAMKEIDMSLGKYMADMFALMQSIKNEWWDRVGFNRQRYGEQLASDGKATTQNAVYRSTVSTKNLAAQFERFIERELNGLIDYAKFAFAKGKQGMLVNSYGQIAMMDVDPIQFMSTEYNVFVVNSFEERENMELVKQVLLQPMAQNGTDHKTLIDIVGAKSIEEIKELATKADAIQKNFELQKQQQMIDGQKEIEELKQQTQVNKDEQAMAREQLKADTSIEVALITSDSFNAGTDKDTNGVDDSQEIVDRHIDRTMKLNKGQMDMSKFNDQQRFNAAKLEMDKRKMESAERIAEMNKNKFDKK